jgi:glycosyltransferase involved in cell wall biosynthesis
MAPTCRRCTSSAGDKELTTAAFSQPHVSVVIKTYDDRERHQRASEERHSTPVLIGYLLETLEALHRQTLAPQEVLVVDSSRGAGIARALEAPEASIGVPIQRILLPSQKFSHPRALNLGIREASGEIISILSGDATPANERWLESLIGPLVILTSPVRIARFTVRRAAQGRKIPHCCHRKQSVSGARIPFRYRLPFA